MARGAVLLVTGVVALVAVYSLRPPSGFGDALMMLGQGRDFYLNEPIYLGLMAISGISAVLGLAYIIKGIGRGRD